jgi:hypothetical protein
MALPGQQREEHRAADSSGDEANRDLDGLDGKSGDEIGRIDEKSTTDDRCDEEMPVDRTGCPNRDERNEETDEGDHPRGANCCPNPDPHGNEDDGAHQIDVDSEMSGIALAEGENIESP